MSSVVPSVGPPAPRPSLPESHQSWFSPVKTGTMAEGSAVVIPRREHRAPTATRGGRTCCTAGQRFAMNCWMRSSLPRTPRAPCRSTASPTTSICPTARTSSSSTSWCSTATRARTSRPSARRGWSPRSRTSSRARSTRTWSIRTSTRRRPRSKSAACTSSPTCGTRPRRPTRWAPRRPGRVRRRCSVGWRCCGSGASAGAGVVPTLGVIAHFGSHPITVPMSEEEAGGFHH